MASWDALEEWPDDWAAATPAEGAAKPKKRKASPAGGIALSSGEPGIGKQRPRKLDFSVAVQEQLLAEVRREDKLKAKHDVKHAKLCKAESEGEQMKRLKAEVKQKWLLQNRDLILQWKDQEEKRQKLAGAEKSSAHDSLREGSDESTDEELSDCSEISDASLGEDFHFKDSELHERFQRPPPAQPKAKVVKRKGKPSAETAEKPAAGHKVKKRMKARKPGGLGAHPATPVSADAGAPRGGGKTGKKKAKTKGHQG
eukprot:TRINITY_DN68493_c0_g1_i1.p1 TRINITY_DN68493_c0_g1~~TRINITY_DN68493_c0_g1_i1.p1  ORF type:complete len:264 (-),score=79.31 TRINITY_DN68493_c0_g1_i1:110-877(-)